MAEKNRASFESEPGLSEKDRGKASPENGEDDPRPLCGAAPRFYSRKPSQADFDPHDCGGAPTIARKS